MVDPARARKLAKRIGTIVATAIDHEIKDLVGKRVPGLAGRGHLFGLSNCTSQYKRNNETRAR